jgi:hypothetical protein
MTHCARESTAGEAVSASHGGTVMNFVAIKMLTGDRAKYLGLIFAIAFSTFLLECGTDSCIRLASKGALRMT